MSSFSFGSRVDNVSLPYLHNLQFMFVSCGASFVQYPLFAKKSLFH